jgi:3-oxosteroid 1-dehydrogenase
MDICQLAYERHNQATAIPSWLIIDARHRRLYPFGTVPPRYTPKSWLTSGYMKKANSIEGIAAACGIDPAGLRQTVERFNIMAKAGIDEDFHRGENAYDTHYGEPKHKPNPCLGPVSTPPYYAVAIYPGDCGTSGGLLTNEHGQVLTPDGNPIGGLYAAGVNAAPVLGRKYPGAGASLGPVTVSGFIAGSHIATHARRLRGLRPETS